MEAFTENTVTEDWKTIMSAEVLVTTMGTFWQVPAIASRVVREVHTLDKIAQNPRQGEWPIEDRLRITVWKGVPAVNSVEEGYAAWRRFIF